MSASSRSPRRYQSVLCRGSMEGHTQSNDASLHLQSNSSDFGVPERFTCAKGFKTVYLYRTYGVNVPSIDRRRCGDSSAPSSTFPNDSANPLSKSSADSALMTGDLLGELSLDPRGDPSRDVAMGLIGEVSLAVNACALAKIVRTICIRKCSAILRSNSDKFSCLENSNPSCTIRNTCSSFNREAPGDRRHASRI